MEPIDSGSPARRLVPPQWLAALAVSLVLTPMAAAQTVGRGELERVSGDFQVLAQRVNPSVVQVLVVGLRPAPSARTLDGLLSRQRGSGSGVIVSTDGYIVTNDHVVRGAKRIQVRLAGNGSSAPGQSAVKPRGGLHDARLIGQDAETDLAVLKIEADGLSALPLADSDDIHQGELVFAFGSPLGLENSVSMGIVSAPVRQTQPDDPMIYIQTDAAIHPGNSGGPLVNAQGEVVGINTFIVSSGVSEALGFAAPSNIVSAVYQQIREHGRVRRGTAGLNAQTVTSELALGLGLERDWGVVIADVFPGGPADQAGLRAGDVVQSLNGKVMENGRQLDVNLYRQQAGEEAIFEIRRDGELRVIRVRLTERSGDLERLASMADPERHLIAGLEILALEIDSQVARMVSIRQPWGVLVVHSSRDASPDGLPLLPGDVIRSANRAAVRTLADLRRELDRHRESGWVTLHVERRGQMMYVPHEIR